MTHLYTVGHSTRSPEEFIEVLREHDIRIVTDVRSFPSSDRYPHFNRESLAELLQKRGIRYERLGEQLGGFRKKGWQRIRRIRLGEVKVSETMPIIP